MPRPLSTTAATLLALPLFACAATDPPVPAAPETVAVDIPQEAVHRPLAASGVAEPQPGNATPAPSASPIRIPRSEGFPQGVNGRLAPEIIQRIVRADFNAMRACYEDGLRHDANLQGRVTVKFVIDRDGTVQMAADGGSTMPDAQVVACVAHAFGTLRFPQPEGGLVTVVYPIQFNPGD